MSISLHRVTGGEVHRSRSELAGFAPVTCPVQDDRGDQRLKSDKSDTDTKSKDGSDLSVAQVAGSALAAAVAAFLAGQLSMSRTIIGAGVVSVVATTGGSLFQHLFRRAASSSRRSRRSAPGRNRGAPRSNADRRDPGRGPAPVSCCPPSTSWGPFAADPRAADGAAYAAAAAGRRAGARTPTRARAGRNGRPAHRPDGRSRRPDRGASPGDRPAGAARGAAARRGQHRHVRHPTAPLEAPGPGRAGSLRAVDGRGHLRRAGDRSGALPAARKVRGQRPGGAAAGAAVRRTRRRPPPESALARHLAQWHDGRRPRRPAPVSAGTGRDKDGTTGGTGQSVLAEPGPGRPPSPQPSKSAGGDTGKGGGDSSDRNKQQAARRTAPDPKS
ncbi:putative protein OS=Streptomyces rimosus subsp. rimosus (strain ATCC / DSM 40260 / JCM 4667 / NRRL 2234) OX=1265868 GN=SRIM_030725 PE=4 SV=1 [Streptomyces rimosus subsp. rimosus]